MEMLPLPPGQVRKDGSPHLAAMSPSNSDAGSVASEGSPTLDTSTLDAELDSDVSLHSTGDTTLALGLEMDDSGGRGDELSRQEAMLNVNYRSHSGSPFPDAVDLSSPRSSIDFSDDTSPYSTHIPLPSQLSSAKSSSIDQPKSFTSTSPRPTHKARFHSHLKPPSSASVPSSSYPRDRASIDSDASYKPPSALAAPAPANLPLSILRLLHAYFEGLAAAGPNQVIREGTRERCIHLVEELTKNLGKAEAIRDSECTQSRMTSRDDCRICFTGRFSLSRGLW